MDKNKSDLNHEKTLKSENNNLQEECHEYTKKVYLKKRKLY